MKKVAAIGVPMRAKTTLGDEFSLVDVGMRPVVWSIAGSDSCAVTGLQADLKALQAFGVHGCTAVAAITLQNSAGVARSEPVSAELLDAQLRGLEQDLPPLAIKTGLLGSVDNVRVVCDWVDRFRARGRPVALVVDPVLWSTTEANVFNEAMVQAYVQQLLPRATLVTPTGAEAERLGLYVGMAWQAGQPSVAIASGEDTRANGLAIHWFSSPQAGGWLSLARVDTPDHHGTRCAFAATAAAALASGYCVADAVVLAKMASAHALRHAYVAGQGVSPAQPLPDFAQHRENLPWLQSQPGAQTAFPDLSNPALGVYAVVDSAAWVRRVLANGIRTVQLRIKDPGDRTLVAQIEESIAIARQTPGAQLFINDHWQLALQHGAYGVHLGQEDMDAVDLDDLRNAGVRLGLSTHSYWEVARAWAIRPSYIACGPIFATQSKDMPWISQGLDSLRYWANLLPMPVVGIAGIDARNVAEVAATGAASAAVISAITQAVDPERSCRELLERFR